MSAGEKLASPAFVPRLPRRATLTAGIVGVRLVGVAAVVALGFSGIVPM